MILKTDCQHFPGDRPCGFNKNFGLVCNSCDHYASTKFKIIIIKFDAVGDVLRTTSLLHAIKKKYPESHITWFTKKSSYPIFQNNSLVNEVLWVEDHDVIAKLSVVEFDLLIHPDASAQSGSFASLIKAKEKKGFVFDAKGNIQPVDQNAVEWLELGAFDQKKKLNEKTYQKILHEICNLEYERGEILLSLTQDEIKTADAFYDKHNLKKFKTIVGLNTGAGSRWQFKQWNINHYVQLIGMIKNFSNDVGILLYGGKDEQGRNEYLSKQFPFVVNTGTDNSLRLFFALINISDIFITGDTLGLHAATALKKKIICLFGPTSSNEIEDYGRIKKISPNMECLVCYKMKCDFSPTCMDLISAELVFDTLKKMLSAENSAH